MNRKQDIAHDFRDRGRALFEAVNTLIAQLEIFGDFQGEFPEVDIEAEELSNHLYETLCTARRLRTATSRLVSKPEDPPVRRGLTDIECTVLEWIHAERVYMWRGKLSLRALRMSGRSVNHSYNPFSDKQIGAYNELLDRGLIIPPDGQGDFAKAVL